MTEDTLGAGSGASHERLPGDQTLQIGGPTTVRGYPTNVVSGDEGYLTSLEVHRDLAVTPGQLDLYAFVDHGTVFSTYPARTTATSAGVGMVWTFCPEASFELSGAVPFTDIIPEQADYQLYARLIVRPPM